MIDEIKYSLFVHSTTITATTTTEETVFGTNNKSQREEEKRKKRTADAMHERYEWKLSILTEMYG